MHCYQFEISCRWVAARLRRRGIEIAERDPSFMEAVSELGLESVADAVGLSEQRLSSVARRLGYDSSEAA